MSDAHMPPQPWNVNENAEPNQWYITSGERKWVIGLILNGEMLPQRQKAVLDRIVACVGACEGIDTELLAPRMLGDQIAAKMAVIDRAECEAKRLKEQNADLLGALREIVANDPFSQSSAGIIARAIVAKAVQP